MIECSICKSRNDEHAAFCAECGQRLNSPNNSSSKLHSPLLDSGFVETSSESISVSSSSFRSIQPSNNSQLRSPLLDSSDIKPDFGQIERSNPNNNKFSRLHSPVLDGPNQGNHDYVEEDLDMPVEEYNSLRSPILASRVPLPEPPKPIAQPVAKPPLENAEPVPQSNQPTIQSLFGMAPQASQSDENYKQFAASLFDQPPQPPELSATPVKPTAVNFTSITGIKKEQTTQFSEASAPFTKKTKNASGGGLLPREEEFSDNKLSASPSAKVGFKATAFIFLLAALIFKFWYCATFGNSLFNSPAFLADQIGQVLVILILFILFLTAKF